MAKGELLEERITGSIIGAFFDVYNELRFGLLESAYAAALERELVKRGHHVAREVSVPVFYKGSLVGRQRLDFVVDHKVIVENKSTELLPPFARRQLLSYLKATSLEVGLLLHYGPEPRVQRLIYSNTDKKPKSPAD